MISPHAVRYQVERMRAFPEAIQEKLFWVYSGARVLEVLESEPEWKPWAGRLHHLLARPELMLEALIMAQQVLTIYPLTGSRLSLTRRRS
eukprot:scaffold80876_cov34-Prasinocladus_malaysianus.AAC.2